MTHQDKPQSSAEIEAEIARERSALSETLDSLRNQFSPDQAIQAAGAHLRAHGGEIAASVARTAKENPMAVALTGIGLAWLIAGSSRTRDASRAPVPASAPYPARDGDLAGLDPDHAPTDDGSAWGRIKDQAARAQDEVRARGEQLRQTVRQTGERAQYSAAAMLERIDQGTEAMSEQARARVRAARLRAVQAQRRIEEQAARRTAQAREFARNEPLVAGAVALAIGAAIGTALPRSRFEDKTFGHHRDRLVDEAERIFREEVRKLSQVAEAAIDEGKAAVQDAVSTAKEQIPQGEEAVEQAERVSRDAAKRVADAARDEAGKQNLGSFSH